MAVIITDMDIPKSCCHCKFCECEYGTLICNLTYKAAQQRDCPLKSADEMIREIENLKDNPHCCQHYERGIKDCLEVTHKYTKEQT